MFGRDDNIYGGSGGVFTGIAQTAIWGGAAYVGGRLIMNKDSFAGVLNKVYDAVAPVQPVELTNYRKMINNVRSMSVEASKSRVLRHETRTALAAEARGENLPSLGNRFKPVAGPVPITHEIGSINYNIGGFDNIRSLSGENIGGKIKEALSKSGMNLDLENVTWKGTQAVIPINGKAGQNFTMEFAHFTDQGHAIIRKGGATYSAPAFYENEINAKTLTPTGNVKISGWNEQILDMLSDEQRLKALALSSDDPAKFIQHISNDPRALEKFAMMRGSHSEAMALIDGSRKEKLIQLAMKSLSGKEEMFVAPTNQLALQAQSGLLRPDIYSSINHEMAAPGYFSNRIGKTAIHNGLTRRPTGRNIMESFHIPMNARPDQILLSRGTLDANSPSFTKRLFAEVNSGGLTPNISAGQTPSRTFYAGGTVYGPPSVEGFKSLSPFGYYKPLKSAAPDWRYRSRYTQLPGANGVYTAGENLAERITAVRGNYSKLGYINFASDEQIHLNINDVEAMKIDAPITVGFNDYNDIVGGQKIKVVPVNGGKATHFTLEDLYNGNSARHNELHTLMTGAEEHRIYGFNKGFKIGLTTDARPVSGMEDPLGVDVVEGYKQLKQSAYMGRDEYAYFASSIQNMHPESKFSIPVRTMSVQTKAAIAGTNARGSVTWGSFGELGGLNSDGAMNRLIGSVFNNNKRRVGEAVVGTFGSKLFKSAIPNMVDGQLVGGKNMQELLQFLHSSILGHAADIYETTGQHVLLEGNIGRKFAHMTTHKSVNGVFNVTDLIENGQMVIDPRNRGVYANHLETSLDVLGALRQKYEGIVPGMSGDIKITDKDLHGARESLTKSWNEIQETFDALSTGTGKASAGPRAAALLKNDSRQLLWPYLAAISGMENMELSQGAKAFNTAEFSMRDQFMFLGGKEGILNELLSRNSTDSVRLMREQELLNLSVGGPEAQAKMPQAIAEHKKFLEDVYGADNPHVINFDSALDSTLTAKQLEENVAMGLGVHNLGVNDVRDNPSIAAESFLAPDKNAFGKIIKMENGGHFFMPSADAIGGFTVLPNGKATFEGKHGGNVGAFWNIAQDASTNGGKLQALAFEQNRYAVHTTAHELSTSRAAIHIDDALYARNLYDVKTTHHDAMKRMEKYMVSGIEKERSVIGNIATISRSDAEALIEEQLKHMLFKKSNLVVEDLNQFRSSWIMADHGAKIEDMVSKGNVKTNTDIRGLAKDIVAERMDRTKTLTSKLDSLNNLFMKPGTSTDTLHAGIKDLSDFVAAKGFGGLVMRNPVIFGGSASGVRTFIREDEVISKRGKKIRRLRTNKNISVGYSVAVNANADQDGDKLQYTPMYSEEANASINKSIAGIQMKTEKLILETKSRMKALRSTPTFKITNKNLKGLTKAIFAQRNATTYAAYMTKAFTGSMNIAALATKGYFEQALQNKKLSAEQIEDVTAWTRTIPSLMTEQQVISSKHLESLISGETFGKTRVEHILGRIGAAKPDEILNIIKESGGNVHPVLQMSLAGMGTAEGTRSLYARPLKYANLSMDIQTGFRRVTQEGMDEFRDIMGHGMNDQQWESHTKSILDRQEKFTPIVEREAFKKAGFDPNEGFIDILSRGKEMQSSNLNVIMKETEELLEKRFGHANIMSAPQEDVFQVMNELREKHFNISQELYQSTLAGGSAEAARQFRWAKQIMPKAEAAMNWIKEAPAQRLGGIALAGMAVIAASNLMFGDSTPTSINDIPSRSSNPLMDSRGGTFGGTNMISSGGNLNSNVGLLSGSSIPHTSIISSINSAIGNRGGHSISVRNDTTNPYADKMSLYS